MKRLTTPGLRSLLRPPLLAVLVGAGAAAHAATADSETPLVATARAALEAHLHARSSRVELTPLASTRPSNSGDAGTVFVARPIASTQRTAARMQVWVDVNASGGRHLRAEPVAFDVKAYRSGWVATRDARAGDALERTEPAFRREIDVAASASEPLETLPEATRLRRPVQAGEPIVASHLEALPDVRRGEAVSVIARIGTIDVEARGEALQDGGTGARVWVRLASSTGPIRGRVVGVKTVAIDHE